MEQAEREERRRYEPSPAVKKPRPEGVDERHRQRAHEGRHQTAREVEIVRRRVGDTVAEANSR